METDIFGNPIIPTYDEAAAEATGQEQPRLKKVPSPEGELLAAPRRLVPDVTTPEIIAAGAAQEAIETDYWMLSDRRVAEYRNQAVKVAETLGYDFLQMHPRLRGRKAQPHEDVYETLLIARSEHPEAFKDIPITEEEILAHSNAQLRAEWDDAEKVLSAAPDTILAKSVPEYVGRIGVGATDEINLPLAVVTAGFGSAANLGRLMLVEGGLSIVGEAATLPKQFRMAEQLDLEKPNAAAQLAFAGLIGASIPVAVRGGGALVDAGGQVVSYTNREIIARLRNQASDLNAEERAAVHALERKVAAEDVGPSADPTQQVRAIDDAMTDIEEGGAPSEDIPFADAEKVGDLITSAPAKDPEPELPAPARVAPENFAGNLGGFIRDAEGAGYDTPSDYTRVAPPRLLTDMTLDEIDAWQAANIAAGAESTAAGGYQIIRKTLRNLRNRMGLDGSEKFTPELQDRLGVELMRDAGLEGFMAGTLDVDTFGDNLAGIWAALPNQSGRSVYAGDGLNGATVARGRLLSILDGEAYSPTGRPPPMMSRFPASSVVANATDYQFRSDIDGQGVSNPLTRVTEWDEILAGEVVVHERLDGNRYIADGHHRLDLARRLEADGHPPISFNGFVLREADGYSVDQVKAMAAVKNIVTGHATAVDTARVLQVDPSLLEKLTMRHAHEVYGRGLSKLKGGGLDYVTNGLVRENHAAFVGDLTDDVEMQDAILRALTSARPKNIEEARQMAQDAYRAGLARREDGAQGSLFDDADLADTLLKERAQTLAAALRQIRRDRRVFETLVKERDRLSEAGNVIADQANAQRVTTDETALFLIETLVNRAGPLDDALNSAARTTRRNGVRQGVREFTATVRSAAEGGDLRRLLDGDDGELAPSAKADGEGSARDGRGAGTGAEAETEAVDDQTLDMFADPAAGAAGLGQIFDNPKWDAPEVLAQVEVAERDLLADLDGGLELDVPTGRTVEAEDGTPTAETVSARDLLDDLDDDTDFLESLNVCKP